MDDFLTQLPTLLGVVIGVLGTLLTTSVADRARWRRDQAVRWDSRRLDAYTAYAAAVKDMHAISSRIAAPYRKGKGHAIDMAEGLAQLAEASQRRSREWESMLLLADEASIEAGRQWWRKVRVEETMARKLPDFDAEAWERADVDSDKARDAFYAAARASLAMTGGSAAKYKA